MNNIDKLVNSVKQIMKEEFGLTNEMARKAFNNKLTEKGKEAIVAAVAKMDEEDETKGFNHKDTFVYKALAKLAEAEVGEAILTTDIQNAAGVKYPQPINKLLSKLTAEGYLERASSHVAPEPKEPGQKGRPKGPEKPKADKPTKAGGLFQKPEKPEGEYSPSELFKKPSSLSENEELMNEEEFVAENEEVNELNFNTLEKSLTDEFGKDGNKNGGKEEVEETEEVAEAEEVTPLNESMLLMQFRAGLITDTEYAKATRKLIK